MSATIKIKRQQIHPLIKLNIHTTPPIRPPIHSEEEKPPPPPNDASAVPSTKEVATQTDPITAEEMIARVLNGLPRVMKQVVEEEKKSDPDSVVVDRPFLLIHTRDIESDEKELLKTYGHVFEWDPSFVNIPLSAHSFRYGLLNLHHKDVRMLLMKTDLTPYHVVIVSRVWESEDDFHEDIQAENVIHSFPPRQAFAPDFNRLLLTPKIRKPSCVKALVRFVLKGLSGG